MRHHNNNNTGCMLSDLAKIRANGDEEMNVKVLSNPDIFLTEDLVAHLVNCCTQLSMTNPQDASYILLHYATGRRTLDDYATKLMLEVLGKVSIEEYALKYEELYKDHGIEISPAFVFELFHALPCAPPHPVNISGKTFYIDTESFPQELQYETVSLGISGKDIIYI